VARLPYTLMKIFVSYSFRDDNSWVETVVIPLIQCFGHQVVTGRILDAGELDEEVRSRIKQCRRVLCFVTRSNPRYDQSGGIVGYEPPDWVRDELMLARGDDRAAIEFRETGVTYEGPASLRPYVEFDRNKLPGLLVQLAQRLAQWPIGPLQLRLSVPNEVMNDIEQAATANLLEARCTVFDEFGTESGAEAVRVRLRDGQLIVPFWVKPDPNSSIEVELTLGARRLACRGISPAVREARLSVV
jgi:hypothetical protein